MCGTDQRNKEMIAVGAVAYGYQCKCKARGGLRVFDVKVGLNINLTFFLFPFVLKLLKIILGHRNGNLGQIYHGSLA